MSEQTPSVGRIVHYVSYGTPSGEYTSQCRAAIVTAVYSIDNPHPDSEVHTEADGAEWVGLAVLNPTGMFFNDACHDELRKQGGTWHWPERV